MKILESKITEITIFKNQAEVTRIASVDLEAGVHTLVFDDLPEYIKADSLQVKGTGNALLKEVVFRKIKAEKQPKDESIWEEVEAIDEEVQKVKDEVARLKNERVFVHNMVNKFTDMGSDLTAVEVDEQKWNDMLSFYLKNVRRLDEVLRKCRKKLDEFENERSRLTDKYFRLGTYRKEDIYQGKVVLEVHESENIQLSLTYMISYVHWKPVYNLKLDTRRRTMNLTYEVVIRQRSGENWEQVPLKISTAEPSQQGKHPDLKPWRVESLKTTLEKSMKLAEKMREQEGHMRQRYEAVSMSNEVTRYSEPDPEQDRVIKEMKELDDQQKEMTYSTEMMAKVATGATSVVFEIAGQHSITNNNEEHKVMITTTEFPVHFRYSTVPKLSLLAYLKAKTTNTSPFPLLEGTAQVFLDGNFVTHTEIQATAPNEEFWTFFGADQRIQVFHKFLRKHEKRQGKVFGKRSRILTYEYEIEVKNHKDSAEEVIVWDQLPISGDEAVKVHLLQPDPKAKEQSITYIRNESEYIQWHKSLKAGETWTIPFSFAIEYPEGVKVKGA